MDPGLWEMLRAGSSGAAGEVEVILRLDDPAVELPGVRIVTRFGPIVTCRLRPESVLPTRVAEHVMSMKSPRRLGPEPEVDGAAWRRTLQAGPSDERRPSGLPLTGRGAVVGVIDWGCDFDHPSFKQRDGSTRIVALWDQRGPPRGRLNRYGYGEVYARQDIDRALATPLPYAALGYHPADADAGGLGSHGTHVMDIAAGNGRGGGPMGVAPAADLVFVHLATGATTGLANLGDSSRILEAVDFVRRAARGRPWVINLSVGSHGGPHDGRTLAEMAFDYVLHAAPGRFMVGSTGNYFAQRIHARGRLQNGEERTLRFTLDAADFTPNELEIWYSGSDAFSVRVDAPTGPVSPWVPLRDQADVVEAGRTVGRLYHRARDPNNGSNHIDLFLYPTTSPGLWSLTLRGDRVADGTFDAWLERDDACPRCQVRFHPSDADPSRTTGTLANGRLPLVVGACDGHQPGRPVAPFSSVGPTRGHVSKPDLVAPGVAVLAARSAPAGRHGNPGLLTRKSGTSMAAPQVTGAVALCFEGAGRLLSSREIRSFVLDTVDAPTASRSDALRYGQGYLNLGRMVEAVLATSRNRRRTTEAAHSTARAAESAVT
jgi:hypothetical protein